MKKLIFFILVLFTFQGFAQQKALVINDSIIRVGIPKIFTRSNGQTFWGGYETRTDLHRADGWRDVVIPQYNSATQRLGEQYYNFGLDVVTYRIVDKTVEELAAEKEAVLQSLENDMDIQAMKRLLRILTKSVLESTTITAQQLADITTIYPQYRTEKAYAINEVFVKDGTLFRVIQAHTSQASWLPASTPALYTKFIPAGTVSAWVQPLGSSDAYKKGDKVTFSGSTYESLIDANVWSPTAYPAGWKKL